MSKRRKTRESAPKTKVRDIFVARPFEGLADEPEWVALRELVPAASARLTLKPEIIEEYGDRPVTLSTVLPMAWPAMSRRDGEVFIGLQRHVQSGDVSRDLAVAILSALRTAPGDAVSVPALPGAGPRLQDVLVDEPLEITMHDGFEYWLDADQLQDASVKASLERANASIYPTVRLSAAKAAYWCRIAPDKGHVRWVLGDAEDHALDTLARLSAAGELVLGDDTKFAGMFRAHGLLVPVWDIPGEPEAADWEAPLADFAKRYQDMLAITEPLDSAGRRARQGLIGRQLTLR
ncbi:DUF5926 family protein [Actinoplanes teichomyceticus]|uniref:DUF5926 domain-containing protein n=1 Tax=Actinoplanes teichomyceticus TaxID=1867 RepID=A0A561WR84_ACTTI|nr:DUF5926 family protein [Actinoplanes teichomyceticus]TWG26370.1 hypothetical protein FHX34_1011354 [Actinoplanes teichomyceticus]GIF11447.1 preprotein translocase SecA [Actinoplanes teichomyceticus]